MKPYPSLKAWSILLELTIYGLLIRSGQLAMILLALQFSQIFTNPAQIIFLFPIAAAVIAILGLLTVVEIECNRYVAALDARLNIITSCTSLSNYEHRNNYLEKTVLPVALNILSLPIIFTFLMWTSSNLFAILLISTAISGTIIFKFNILFRKVGSNAILEKTTEYNLKSQNDSIPLYLVKTYENKSTSKSLQKIVSQQNSQQDYASLLKIRKRKYLGLIKQSTRVIVLLTAVVLAVFSLTSITKIAGFLLIGNVFRSGCLAVFEFMSSTPKLFPLRECINLLSISLIKNDDIEHILSESKRVASSKRIKFNQRYTSLIKNHPYLRLKNVSIKDVDGAYIASNITSRLMLKPMTFVYIPSNNLAVRVKKFASYFNNNQTEAKSLYYISGEAFLGKRKLANQFFDELKIYDPSENYIPSLNIFDYFNESYVDELTALTTENNDLVLLLDSIVNPNIPIQMHGPRQLNQFRAILQLITIALEPSSICVLLYCFESLDPSDMMSLINIFEPIYEEKFIHVIALIRSPLPANTNSLSYQYTSDNLMREPNHA